MKFANVKLAALSTGRKAGLSLNSRMKMGADSNTSGTPGSSHMKTSSNSIQNVWPSSTTQRTSGKVAISTDWGSQNFMSGLESKRLTSIVNHKKMASHGNAGVYMGGHNKKFYTQGLTSPREN